MSLSDYSEGKLLGQLLGITPWEGPVQTYIGLFSNTPNDTVPGQLIVDAGLRSIDWSQTGSTAVNVTTVTFGPANDDWGTVEAFGLFDRVASGNQLLWGLFEDPVSVSISGTFTVAPGDIEITF